MWAVILKLKLSVAIASIKKKIFSPLTNLLSRLRLFVVIENIKKKIFPFLLFKSSIFFLLVGLLITICFIFIPLIYDPIIAGVLPIQSIDKDQRLVSYLASIQNQDNIIIGVHGYIHRSPVSGNTICEYHCLGEEISSEIVRERIEKGINIFQMAGLHASWIAPPGMYYDDKLLYLTEKLGYVREPYSFGGSSRFKSQLEEIVTSEAQEKINRFKNKEGQIIYEEYTWEWGKLVNQDKYDEAKMTLKKDMTASINGLLLHIQDYNDWTEAFIKEALQYYRDIKFIRVDDITSGDDVSQLKRLVSLANETNRLLLIAVIPARLTITENSRVSSIIKITWIIFVSFFLFPIAIMVPLHWWERRKIRKTGRKIPGSPKVSLILPAYNEEKFIGKSIEQSLKQDYRGEIEIVIIDDGSTDRTFEIANEYGRRYPNVKVYKHEKNSGKPAALNTGFHKATGEISIFSDTDSHLASDLVSRMIPHFDDPRVGMVAGMIIIDNEINTLTRLQQIEYLYNQEIVRFCQAAHKGVLICPGAATAVRTKIAQDIPSTERTVTEDADFTFEVAKAGWKVTQEPEAISRTDAPENWKSLINQRKRWLYGVLQTLWIHKWAILFKDTKVPNLWVWWAWIGYITCPITTLSVLVMPLFFWLIGSGYLIFLAFYSLLVGAIFTYTHWYGLKQYTHTKKTKLILLIPLYMVYQYLLNVLLFYLVIAFIFRKGIIVRYGGRDIHAV